MANALYDFGREGFLDGSIDWDTDDIRLVFCTAAYVRNLATDQFLSDIAGGARVGVSPSLVGKAATAGVASAGDPVISVTGVATQAVIYQHTGVDGTSRLICNYDTVTGFPTSAGQTVTFEFDTGPNKCFKL